MTSFSGSGRRRPRGLVAFGRAVGRTPLLPCQAQTGEEGFEGGLGAWRRRIGCGPLARKLDQRLLGRADLAEQAHGIELGMLRIQGVLHRLRHARVRDQTLMRRQRRMIALPDASAVPLLPGKLEGRLEEVHEQPHGSVEARQGLRGGKPLQTSVAHHPPHDRAVLLLDVGLVVLAIGS